MPRQCCFLCASDEGVFLDITADNKHVFHEKFEICSLVKVPTEDQLPSKLCHKCVYELNQCSSFVQRFKRITKQKKPIHKCCCSLCHKPAKKELIFDLSKDQSLQHNSFDKIQKVFEYDFKNFKEDHRFICLSCRYTLDVLFDLKNISKETAIKLNDIINEKVNYINMPKIKTFVVSRKTTITESARTNLPTLQESDNDSVMTRNNNKSNKTQKQRSCGKCKKLINIKDDRYTIHKIRTSVCKQCWENSGHDKNEVESQILQNVTEAKVCKVFLEDVLKNTELKEQKLYTVNMDSLGNKTYVVKNKNVENESKPDSIVNNTRNGVSKQSQKRSITDAKEESKQTDNEPTLPKRSKIVVKRESGDSKESESIPRETRQRNATTGTQNVDSDSSVSTRRSERTLTRQKRASGASLSDADIDSKRYRSKLRNILEGNVVVIKSFDLTDESSSNEDTTPRKKQRFASTSPVPTKKRKKRISKKDTLHQKSKNGFNKQLRYIRQSKTSQELQSSESDIEEVVFDTTTYICDECGASYENKLMGLTHKLTHYKQPKIELEKVKDKEIAKEVSDTNETTDEQSKDQSEAVMIKVDDDEEEPVKDMNDLTESNTEDKSYYSKKEAMEDAVDMELVMKESDDDCTQTEKKTDESQKEEETTDTVITNSLTPDEADNKNQNRNSSDNNNDTFESVEKENIQSEEKHNNTSVSNIEDKEEEKQNSLPNDSEDIQQEKDQEEKDKEEQNPEENESEINENNEKEDENKKEQVTRTERKDSSEEEVISLGIWEENEGSTDKGSLKNSNNDTANDEIDFTKADKRNGVEKKVEEDNTQEIEIDKQKSPKCTKKRTSSEGNKDQIAEENNTIGIDRFRSIIIEDTVLEKSITIGDKNSDNDSEKISKSEVSKQEEQNECVHVAAEVLQEVIDLASAEVQKRQNVTEIDDEDNSNDAETLENISREIQNSVEVPSVE